MANPFAITAATNSVSLNSTRQGQASFTISNTTTQHVRSRARVVAPSATAESWLKLLGEAERDFASQESQQYIVQIAVPPNAPAGEYAFRLDMVDVANPDDNFSEGPTVKFIVPVIAPPARKPFSWWIIAVIAGVLIIIGGSIFAIVHNLQNMPAQATPTPITLLSHWQNDPSTLSTPRYGPAATLGPDGRIYALGGFNGTYLKSAEVYDPKIDKWTPITDMSTPRYGLAAALGADGRIYAIGGFNGTGAVKTAEAYDPKTNKWAPVADMSTPRYLLAAVPGPDGRIYAIGGYTGSSTLKSVEAYDPKIDNWAPVADRSTPRYSLAVAPGPDGRIYAIGGFDGTNTFKTVEAYDPKIDKWAPVADMLTPRDQLAATLGPDGRIYAIGGYNGSYLNTVEFYDPKIKSWANVAPLLTSRAFPAAVSETDGRIYVIGGFNGSSVLNTVEIGTGSDWLGTPTGP